MKRLLGLIILFDFFTVAYGQSFNLNDCMLYAIERNHEVKKQEFLNDNYRQDKTQAIASLFPTVEMSSQFQTNYGRSINPETNTYNTTGNLSNPYSISTQMPVFAGFRHINTVKVARVMQLMGVEKLQQIKDETAIKTMQAYFDVVYFTNSVEITGEQLATSRTTLEQSAKMYELGRKSLADVAQVESQVASDEFLLIEQENKLELALLALKKQMNFPLNEELVIDTDINEDTFLQDSTSSRQGIAYLVDYAVANNPKMLASLFNVKQNKLNLHITQGSYAPSLYIQGGFSTNYFKTITGAEADYVAAPFADQFWDNRGYWFGASLNIPIFNGLSRRTDVHRGKNTLKIAEQDNAQLETELRTEVTQAVLEMRGYEKEYEQAGKKVKASQLSYDASLNKYKLGMVNPIDLQTTANLLLTAKSQQLNARLQYMAKRKLVSYYNGEPLVNE